MKHWNEWNETFIAYLCRNGYILLLLWCLGFYRACGLRMCPVSETQSISEQEKLLRSMAENIGVFVVSHSEHLRTSDCIGRTFPASFMSHSCLNLNTVKLLDTHDSSFRCARLIFMNMHNFIFLFIFLFQFPFQVLFLKYWKKTANKEKKPWEK